jgi:hypothetical protein
MRIMAIAEAAGPGSQTSNDSVTDMEQRTLTSFAM